MKKKRLLIGLLSVSMMFAAGTAIAGCESDPPVVNPPIEKPEDEHKAPVVTVNPATVEINAGEEFEPLFGVTAKDENGNEVNVIVKDDGGFDVDTEGTYTITYAATANGLEGTATRTLKVNRALAALTLEVRENKLGEQKWQGNTLNFKHHHYSELETNTELPAQSGVFKNASDAEIVLSVEGGYGVSAVIDKNGVVVEGRDGANGRLVNAANPTRAGSSATTLTVGGEEVTVVSAFAKELHIPAGGFAIVVQTNYVGTTVDTDGRGFMNYNVIGEVGNVVRLGWADAEEGVFLTTYVNQGPTVTGNTPVFVVPGSAFDPLTALKEGITVKDDNGTFDISDDVTLTVDSITVEANSDFDINTVGDYTFNLVASDGEKSTNFTRVVKIVDESFITKVSIGTENNSISVLNTAVCKDTELTAIGSYAFIIYTYEFKSEHSELGFANGYGEAYVVDKYGKILRTYDGANGNYYDADNLNGLKDATKCDPKLYAQQAYASLAEGEILFIAPHSTANSAAGGSRHFFSQLGNRTKIGATFTFTGFDFEEKPYVFTVGEGEKAKSNTALESKYAFNDTAVNASTASKYGMIVFTQDFSGTVVTNGSGVAIVLDKYGKLIKLYDAANGGYYEGDATKKALPFNLSTTNYATYAFENLSAGETLVIFPHSGTEENPRAFGLSLRSNDYIGKYVTLTGVEFADPNAEPAEETSIKIGDNTFKIQTEKVAVNPDAAGSADVAIFTTAYSGAGFANGYGIALIIKDGKIVRVYDGISAKLTSAEQPAGGAGCTATGYLTEALASLKAGEYALVGLNNGEHLFREFLRTAENRVLEKEVTVSGIDFSAVNKDLAIITVNGKSFFNPVIAVNTEVAKLGDYEFAVYTYGYSGIRLNNNFAVIFVMDNEGKIVRLFDPFTQKYYTAGNPEGIALPAEVANTNSLALDFFKGLNPGETMLVGINGGANNGRARSWLSGCKTDALGKDVAFTGITVPEAAETEVKFMSITIGTKTWYQDVSKVAHNAAYEGNPAFAVYEKSYDGALISNSHGEAFIIDKETGKVVKIFDGANAKYYDADNKAGVQNGTCTAAGYIAEAFAALEEGQILLIAPSNAGNGHYERGFLYGNRTIDVAVEIVFPEENQE